MARGAIISVCAALAMTGASATAQSLPAPTRDPLHIDPAADPILGLAERSTPPGLFRDAIASAVKHNPALDESVARRDEAEGARNEARARQYPTVDLSLTHFETISRAFSNDPDNILERSRPLRRTDAAAHVQQPVFDFGATANRIRAGNARLTAAAAGIDDAASQVALNAIAAWYNVFGYRTLVRLGEAFGDAQMELRGKIEARVRQGVAAEGDLAQVDSYIAASGAQLAQFRRDLASAEAQYTQLIGAPPPPSLGRAPAPASAFIVPAGDAEIDALPTVRQTRALADAAGRDAKAARADARPSVSVGADYGRYGLIETARDYDLRANATLSWRLFGGASQRIDQADARANGADARLERTREEALRDARIAWSDVTALEAAKAAIGENYLASRRSRDVLTERYRVSRGSLLDLLSADSNYFGVAARYIQTLIELDTARYTLLARTGRLLDALGIARDPLDAR